MKILFTPLTSGQVSDIDTGISSNLVQFMRIINESNLYVYVQVGGQEDYLAPWDDTIYQTTASKLHMETSSIASGGASPSPYSTLVTQVYLKGEDVPAHNQQASRRQLVRQASPNALNLSMVQANGGPPGPLSVTFAGQKGVTGYIHSFLVVIEKPPATADSLSIGPTAGVHNAQAVSYWFQEGADFQPSVFFQYPSPLPATGKNTSITMTLTLGSAVDYFLYVWGFYQ